MEKVLKISGKITAGIAVLSMIGYSVICLLSIADVVAYRGFNSPILGAYEIVEVLMVASVFCSFAYAQSNKAHINMPIVVEKLPRPVRLFCILLTSGLSIYIASYLAYAAFTQAQFSVIDGKMTGMINIPWYPFYFIEAAAMIVFTIILVIDTVVIILAFWSDKWNKQVITDFGMTDVKEYREKEVA